MFQLIGLLLICGMVYAFAQQFKIIIKKKEDPEIEAIKNIMAELKVDFNDPHEVEKWVDLIARTSKKQK